MQVLWFAHKEVWHWLEFVYCLWWPYISAVFTWMVKYCGVYIKLKNYFWNLTTSVTNFNPKICMYTPTNTSTTKGEVSRLLHICKYNVHDTIMQSAFSFDLPQFIVTCLKCIQMYTIVYNHYQCVVYIFLIGKYLNNYALKSSGMNVSHVPPGWSKWFGLVGNRYTVLLSI